MMPTPLSPLQQSMLQQAQALHQGGQFAQARDLYRQILQGAPDNADILRLLGTVECQVGNWAEGERVLGLSLAHAPDQPGVHFNRANAFLNLRRPEEALASFERTVALKPDYAQAHCGRGNVLTDLKRPIDAVLAYDRAVALRPDYVEAHYNRGNALQTLKRHEEAVAAYDRALALQPNFAEAWNNRGHALQTLERLEEAVASYDKALTLQPGFEWLAAQALHTRMLLADWDGFDARVDRLLAAMARKERVSTPFQIQAFVDSASAHRDAAEIYVTTRTPVRPLARVVKYAPHERIRVAYLSSDFKDHPVTHLLAGMFERHDRTKFDIFAFSYGPQTLDPWRARVTDACEHFIDVSLKSDREIAEMARAFEIDIAIDLNGHTNYSRTGVFAERAAPVQAGYIGFLGTMGTPFYDYLIADATLIPADRQSAYCEKIVRLPSFQVNDDRVTASDRVFSKAELGLPDEGFIFCSFNNSYKITPHVFDGWMRILARTPGSVLWLFAKNPATIANLKTEAVRRGIGADRLVFAGKLPLDEHMARQRAADLFLDSHPYNAGATASCALKVGLPVLTRIGDSFPSRMGASLLNAAGLPELITATPEAYEALAIELATHPAKMAAIRQKLTASLPGCALFDTEGATRAMEAAYVAMYKRHSDDLPPDHITI